MLIKTAVKEFNLAIVESLIVRDFYDRTVAVKLNIVSNATSMEHRFFASPVIRRSMTAKYCVFRYFLNTLNFECIARPLLSVWLVFTCHETVGCMKL